MTRVHQVEAVYFRDTYVQLSFVEEPSNRWFPELQDLPSSVTYMDVRVVGDQRMSVVGCQNGYLRCAVVTLTSCSKYSILCV